MDWQTSALKTSNEYIKYRIYVSETAQSVAANTTTVRVRVKFYRTNSHETYGHGTVYCRVAGVTYSAAVTQSQIIDSGGIYLFDRTLTVAHNADGTKALKVTAWIDHSRFTSDEDGMTVQLTAIPRATTPQLSASSLTLGDTLTLTLPRAVDTFTHDLTYAFGTASGTIATGATDSAIWAVPESLVTALTTAESGPCTITCVTWSGSTKIGTQTVTLTLAIPEDVVPVITAVTAVEAVEGLEKYGAFVQGKSQVQVAVQATGAQGSTVKIVSAKLDDRTYAGTAWTSEVLTTAGDLTLAVKVTDSRGRTADASLPIPVLPYAAPLITLLNCDRCAADGSEDPEGEYLDALLAWKMAEIGTCKAELACRKDGDTDWIILATFTEPTGYRQYISEEAALDPDYPYLIRLTVADDFASIAALTEVGTGAPLIDKHASGTGLAIGEVCRMPGKVTCALPVTLHQGVTMDGEDKTINGIPMEDTGWISAEPLMTEAFTAYKTEFPRYRRIGKMVQVHGIVKPTAEITGATARSVIFTLPSGFRPSFECVTLMQGSGNAAWECSVRANGAVSLARYRTADVATGTSYSPAPVTVWLPFSMTFFVD